MGEIKSTLDLIMEKTKGLTMTEEEKKALKRREMEGNVKGVVQKFLDGIFNLEGVTHELGALHEKGKELVQEILQKELMTRIRPGEDNGKIIKVLEKETSLDVSLLNQMLSEFESNIERERKKQEKRQREALAEKGISGSALIPNLEARSEWVQYESELKQRLKRELGKMAKSHT